MQKKGDVQDSLFLLVCLRIACLEHVIYLLADVRASFELTTEQRSVLGFMLKDSIYFSQILYICVCAGIKALTHLFSSVISYPIFASLRILKAAFGFRMSLEFQHRIRSDDCLFKSAEDVTSKKNIARACFMLCFAL